MCIPYIHIYVYRYRQIERDVCIAIEVCMPIQTDFAWYKYVYIIYMYIYHILTCIDLKININMYILMLYMGICIYICQTFPHKWKNLCFDELPIPITFFMSFICTLLLFNIRSFYHIWRHVKSKARWRARR